MKFSFLGSKNLARLLESKGPLESPSAVIKNFGPYLLSSLFAPQEEFSLQLNGHLERHINKSKFLGNLKQKTSNSRYKLSVESLSCAIMVDNENIQDKEYVQQMFSKSCTAIEAATLAYHLIVQKCKGWQRVHEKDVVEQLAIRLRAPTDAKFSNVFLQQQLFMSDILCEYPQVINSMQLVKSYPLDLPINFFCDHLKESFKSYFFEGELFIDLKIGNQVYMVMKADQFSITPVRTFLLRYVRMKKTQNAYPNAKVIWITDNVSNEEVISSLSC